MGATEHSFSEVPPQRLYLDTNIILEYLVETEPHHSRSTAFLDKVSSLGLTAIYLSSISWIEFVHVVLSEDFRNGLPSDTRQLYQLSDWGSGLVRRNYLVAFVERMKELLAHFDVYEIELTSAIQELAVTYSADHKLDSQDAVHLASMTMAHVLDLASFDSDFRDIDGLHLWNDNIHMRA